MGCFAKFLFIIEIPFRWVRDITIPVCRKERYSRFFLTIIPTTAPNFLMLATGLYKIQISEGFSIIWITLVIGFILSILVFCSTRHCSPDNLPRYDLIYSFGGFF